MLLSIFARKKRLNLGEANTPFIIEDFSRNS